MTSRLSVIREERIKKLDELKKLGINPYPSHLHMKLQAISFARKNTDETVSVAGRIMGMRGHGAILFGDLKDESGQIQILFSEENLKEKYSILKLIDTGDFLAVTGKVIKTKAGEITIEISDFQLLSKSINPLPSVWHGLKDVEERYRKRYLDSILNPEVAERLHKRSLIVSAIRELLNDKGFLEVETPTLQPLYGGGFARPFTTHHNTLDSDFYLRISDEMYLKRLIVGGFEKVYEITKVFRNEGMDQDHNPEFTMFEAQIAYEDYTYGMDITEDIFGYCAKKVFGTTTFDYQGNILDFKKPWNKMKLVEAVNKIAGINPLEWKSLDEAKKSMQGLDIDEKKIKELQKINTIGEVIAFAFEELVEEKLIQPTIIYDYPIEVSPLAKKCDDERFTQRFEIFAAGSELGNNYSELNDPIDLRKRFVDEKKKEAAGNDEAHQTDEDYLTAIEHGFPPTCGLGIGIDRMAMMMTNAKTIKEIIAFPTLRPEFSIKTKKEKISSTQTFTNYAISDAVKAKFPGVSFAYTVIRGVKIKKVDNELEKLKKETIEKRKSLTLEQISEIEPIKVYRKMFKETGIDLGSRKPSPEALIRRIVQGKNLYNINTAVDAYNLAVVETGVGLGGFNFKKITEPVVLRLSEKGEEMHLLGDETNTKTEEGELVYSDKEKLLTLDLNYRDINKTKITDDTTDIILFADGGPGLGTEIITNALKKGADYIMQFCGGKMDEIKIIQ